MPIAGGFDIWEYTQSLNQQGLKPYPIKHGSDIYTYDSMTGLARSPLEDLASYILGVVQGGPFSLDPEAMTKQLLSAGSVVVIDPQTEDRRFFPYIYASSERSFIAYLPDDDGCLNLTALADNLDRVYSPNGNILYTLSGDKWTGQYLDEKGKVAEWPDKIKGERSFPAERLHVIPNGRGLLYWAQKLFWRLEEIAETERLQMTGPNLVPIISGPGVGDESTASRTLNLARRAMFFPDIVQVDRIASTAMVQMLIDWFEARKADWYDNLNAVQLESVQRPVAQYGSQQMMSTLRFANRIRDRLRTFYADVYSEEIKFDRIITISGDELTKQIGALQLVREIIGEDRYAEQVNLLLSM